MNALPDWTRIDPSARDEILVALCRQGQSARQIADSFQNCSRSAVIGRIHRLQKTVPTLVLGNGTHKPGPKKTKSGDAKRTPSKPKTTKPRATKHLKKTVAGVVAQPMRSPSNPHPNDFKARAEQRLASPGLTAHQIGGVATSVQNSVGVPQFRMVPLDDLNHRTCKWPIGDPLVEGFAFCGNDAPAQPYCTYHSRIAYTPPPTRKERRDVAHS